MSAKLRKKLRARLDWQFICATGGVAAGLFIPAYNSFSSQQL
jgi:hypothetical protein